MVYRQKIKVIVFITYYLPGYKSGGPVRSITNMVDQLSDEFNFSIITKDRDAQDLQKYPDVQIDTWNQVGKAKVYYMSPQKEKLLNLASLLRKTSHNVVYLNSFFSYKFAILPLFARWLKI